MQNPDQGYLATKQFQSPVTGETFSAPVLAIVPPVTDRDFDGCDHWAINALSYALVIDPASGYVAYPEDFAKPAPWTREQLTRVLGHPRFSRSAGKGQPWEGAYAWEKFENAAKLAVASHATSATVANWWLQAAWSVRLDLVPAQADFADTLDGVARALRKPAPDPAQLMVPYELQLAGSWAQLAEGGRLGSFPEADADQAIAWLYRAHGELVAARHWLGKAAQADGSIRGKPLYAYLDNSIKLERDYLAQAADFFRKAYDSGELDDAQRGAAAFTLGELSRRLGHLEDARKWYADAAGHSLGLVNPAVLARERAVVEKGRLW